MLEKYVRERVLQKFLQQMKIYNIKLLLFKYDITGVAL